MLKIFVPSCFGPAPCYSAASVLFLCETPRNHCLENPGCSVFWGMGCFSKALCDEQPDVQRCGNCEQDLQLPRERGWKLSLQPDGRGRQAGSSMSSTHPEMGITQLLGRGVSPECGHSEFPPQWRQQHAQPFPGHLFHSLSLLWLCQSPPLSAAARGLGAVSVGTSWGSSCAGGCCVGAHLHPTAGLWGHGCHLP